MWKTKKGRKKDASTLGKGFIKLPEEERNISQTDIERISYIDYPLFSFKYLQEVSFDNIVLGTHSENLLDSLKEVRSARSVKAGHAHRKYDHEKVVELFKSNLTYKEISQITNIPIKIVRSIIYKKLWIENLMLPWWNR